MSVRKDKKKMFNQVKDILIHHESCRDSDIKLSYVIYSKVDRDFAEGSIVSFFSKLEMRSLPSFSTIGRARRLVQERHPELRGDKYKGRQRKALKDSEYYIEQKINIPEERNNDFHTKKLS
jgi:hypothetical protein